MILTLFILLLPYCMGQENTLAEIFFLFDHYGNEHYLLDEPVTQSSHALQSAWIAKKCNAPEEVIISLLLHDIGQLTKKELIGKTHALHEEHDQLGALWLKEKGFPSLVVDFAKYHTMAKVALCQNDSDYYNHLSKASQESFHLQKEKYIHSIDYQNFLSHPYLQELLAMRLCDDLAKCADERFLHQLQSLSDYEEMILRVIKNREDKSNPEWILNLKQLSEKKRKDPTLSLDLLL